MPNRVTPTAAALLLALAADAADPDAGRRLYREGILQSGRPVEAVVAGDVSVQGAQWSCESCHRRSGLGAAEGGTAVPPITADALFRPAELLRADRLSTLFEEGQPLALRARARTARGRPAYDLHSLATALRHGSDPAARALDPAMPRYRIGDADLANLTAYLSTLGAVPAPGVDATCLHLATVIAGDVDPAARASLLSILNAWIAQQNREADYQARKVGRVAWDRVDEFAAARRWTLHVWEPAGPPASWARQLNDIYSRQPVFAVVGGLTSGPWQPVAEFCDRAEIPCLFPETSLPADTIDTGYTVHFSRGMAAEAAALASHLRDTRPVLQFFAPSPESTAAAGAFTKALPSTISVPIPPDPSPTWWQSAVAKIHPAAVVIWAADSVLQSFDCAAARVPVYLSATLATRPCPAAGLVSVATLGENPSRERVRMKNWQLSRGIQPGNERIQLDAQFVLALLDDTLHHMAGRFSREYLLETLERETATARNPGVYPFVALGPAQRTASKGVWLLRPGASRPKWTIP